MTCVLIHMCVVKLGRSCKTVMSPGSDSASPGRRLGYTRADSGPASRSSAQAKGAESPAASPCQQAPGSLHREDGPGSSLTSLGQSPGHGGENQATRSLSHILGERILLLCFFKCFKR